MEDTWHATGVEADGQTRMLTMNHEEHRAGYVATEDGRVFVRPLFDYPGWWDGRWHVIGPDVS